MVEDSSLGRILVDHDNFKSKRQGEVNLGKATPGADFIISVEHKG